MEAIYNFQRWGLPFFEQKEIPRDYAANALIPKMGKKLFSGKKSWNDNDLIDNYCMIIWAYGFGCIFYYPVNNNVGGKVLSYPVMECAKQAAKSHFDANLLRKLHIAF